MPDFGSLINSRYNNLRTLIWTLLLWNYIYVILITVKKVKKNIGKDNLMSFITKLLNVSGISVKLLYRNTQTPTKTFQYDI